MTTALVWFRNDLRITDNPALAAASVHDQLLPVYIEERESAGDWPAGGASRWWLHHSLDALAFALQECGSRLVICRGPASRVLPQLVRESGAEHVYWNRRYEPAAVASDKELKRHLREDGVAVTTFNASLLFAFATLFPDYEILFMLIIPMRMKWVGLITAFGYLWVVFFGSLADAAAVLVAFLNYFIFFGGDILRLVRLNRQTRRARVRFQSSLHHDDGQPFHRCSRCGRSDETDPQMEFRVAEDGEEYCLEHLPGGEASDSSV